MPTDDDDEVIIIRRANAVKALRIIANDNAGALEQSQAGELREVAEYIDSGRKPSLLRQLWTFWLLRPYLFP